MNERRVSQTGRYICAHCNTEQVFTLSGPDEALVESLMDNALEAAQNDHWYGVHHMCAVCGQSVRGTDFDLAVNDGRFPIHKDYSHYYGIRVKSGDTSFCLSVHKRCIK